MSNEDLIEAIISGDLNRRNQAFRQIYRDSKMQGKVHSLAAYYNINEVDMEELLHDSIIRLDEAILNGQFRRESAIITFLIAIVQNKMRDKLKMTNRIVLTEEVQASPELEQTDSPDFAFLQEEKSNELQRRNAILQRLLGKLNGKCQKLLANYYYLSKSMDEVATEQGLANANQAKKAAHRCRKYLRELIKAEPGLENFLKETL